MTPSASSSFSTVNESRPPSTHGEAGKAKGEPLSVATSGTAANNKYPGAGTEEDPFVVNWDDDDAENPKNWSSLKKWMITVVTSSAVLALAFTSSAYAGASEFMMVEFNCSQTVITLGVSLFVCGFAFGPLLWAPLSELLGRRLLFLISYGPFVLFNIGPALAQNLATLLVTRFLGGFFGSSPLTNSGGVIGDMFTPAQSGLAIGVFAVAPFLGPVLGPIISGFMAENVGWRDLFWLIFAFTGFMFLLCVALVPETYAPVLLRKRAAKLTKETGKKHLSQFDANRPPSQGLGAAFKIALTRPFAMLFKEPICLAWALYAAFIYGLLYLFFVAYPIVYQRGRGWSAGIGGLPFIGIGIGMVIATLSNIFIFQRMYMKKLQASPIKYAPPEARLPMAMVGAAMLPIGLFLFAWTSQPSVHWAPSVIGGGLFGLGMVLIFLCMMTMLVDIYMLYAASALAANSVLRSLFGAGFPLFAPYMYQDLGNQWASSLLAFLALAFVPMPFLFWKYGARLRAASPMAVAGTPPQLRAALEAMAAKEKERDAEAAR